MKLVIIVGPQAVGKMTVGQELAKATDLKLFRSRSACAATAQKTVCCTNPASGIWTGLTRICATARSGTALLPNQKNWRAALCPKGIICALTTQICPPQPWR